MHFISQKQAVLELAKQTTESMLVNTTDFLCKKSY